MSLVTADGTWLDIRAVRIDGSDTTRVARYRRAPGEPAAAGSALSLDEIKDAVNRVFPRVLEAALVESRASFALTSDDLIDLDDAGVPDGVTDLLVALSYPERFVVERATRGAPSIGELTGDTLFMPWTLGSPLFGFSPFYDDLFYPAYYYSPFAYSYAGRGFDPFGFGFYGPGYITVVPGGGVPDEVQPSGQGRVVNGLGYTRVRPRETERAAGGGQNASGRRSSGGESSGGTSSGATSSGSSSGGSVSGQGFSSGSSGGGGGGGRTAVPR
jgi:hypothetical protein